MIDDQLAFGRAHQRFGQWTRGHVRIEHHQRHARGLEKDHRHHGGGEKCPASGEKQGADRADQKCHPATSKGSAKIREGLQASDPPCGRAKACRPSGFWLSALDISPGAGYVARPETIASRRPARRIAGSRTVRACRAVIHGPPSAMAEPMQQRQRRIAWHRIIFLRGREGEEDQNESGPGTAPADRVSSGAIDRFERQLRRRREDTRSTERARPDGAARTTGAGRYCNRADNAGSGIAEAVR